MTTYSPLIGLLDPKVWSFRANVASRLHVQVHVYNPLPPSPGTASSSPPAYLRVWGSPHPFPSPFGYPMNICRDQACHCSVFHMNSSSFQLRTAKGHQELSFLFQAGSYWGLRQLVSCVSTSWEIKFVHGDARGNHDRWATFFFRPVFCSLE